MRTMALATSSATPTTPCSRPPARVAGIPQRATRTSSRLACSCSPRSISASNDESTQAAGPSRRSMLASAPAAAALLLLQQSPARADADFVTLPSGLKVQDIRPGEGASPSAGDTVVVHWAGFTKGYQGKRIDNTSIRDEPYEFVLGQGQAIKAFEEAVSGMTAGGIRRIEVPGSKPELGYSLDRKERFTDELISPDLKIYKYRVGPQPAELGGQRALDFVLDNSTLQDFNRTLLFDIKLLAVRKARR